jgi:hypothetical protein
MTTKSHRRSRPRHVKPRQPQANFFMESLGFIENPSVSYVTAPPQAAPRPAQLVSTSSAPAVTVEEMWDTTELYAESLADWEPDEMDRNHLGRRLRWKLIVFWIFLISIVAAACFWAYQRTVAADESALAAVTSDSEALYDSLTPLLQVTAAIVPGDEIALDLGAATTDVDNASRALFSSSAALPAAESEARAAATEAATLALDASKSLSSTAAYLGAVTPVLTGPDLITEPDLVELTDAAGEFGDWISQFESVRSILPENAFAAVSAELAGLSLQLEGIQSSYLDGLREKDQVLAQAALAHLEAELTEVSNLLDEETASFKETISESVAAARESLVLLAG